MDAKYGNYYRTAGQEKVQFFRQKENGNLCFVRCAQHPAGWVFETDKNGHVVGTDTGNNADDVLGEWEQQT